MKLENNISVEKEKNKVLLSKSVGKKISKIDTEKVLYDYLYPKFGKRFLDYRKKYENYLTDSDHKEQPSFPVSLILELVNRCNLECVMCFQGYRNDTKKNTLTLDTLRKIFKEFKKEKLDALLLSTSETLLHKDYPEILKMAEEAEIMDQFLFTNGTLLNEKNSRLILNSSLTRVFISIDAATNETYDKVRIPVNKKIINTNRLNQIEKNVKNFMKLRNSLGKKIPLVRVSFVALESNQHEIDDFIKKWENIVDSVEIQKESSIDFYKDFDKSIDINNEKKFKRYNCNQPWGQITIHSDGTVGPCCNTIGRNLPIGNIHDSTVKEIWDGIKMNKIRSEFKTNQPNKVCQLCIENEKTNY